MGAELPIDISAWCGVEGTADCGSIRPHAVLLDTYWISDN